MATFKTPDHNQLEIRKTYTRVFIIILFGLLFLRMWFLQIYQGDVFKRYSEQNRIRKTAVEAPRGMIFDRHKHIMMDNKPAFDIAVTLEFTDNIMDLVPRLALILSIPEEEVRATINKNIMAKNLSNPFVLKQDLNRNEIAAIEDLNIFHPGFEIVPSIRRTHILGSAGAQLMGYISEATREELDALNSKPEDEDGSGTNYTLGQLIGKAGLEKQWNQELMGKNGTSLSTVDARGRSVELKDEYSFLQNLRSQPYIPGNNLILTIDKYLQSVAYRTMVENDRIGTVVALKPDTGEILAMVSVPSYNPTEFNRGIDKELWRTLTSDPFKPLRNKAVQDHYAPASTIKPFVALAALSEGIINEHDVFFCPGYLKFKRRKYHCGRKWGHGDLNVQEAISGSCNVFFFNLGIKMGVDLLHKWAIKYGFSNKLGIKLPGEKSGFFPTSAWKMKRFGTPWQEGENLSIVIGEGFDLVTPIQLAAAFSIIANGGKLFRPYAVSAIESPDGTTIKSFSPRLIRDLKLNTKYLEIVKRGMRGVFTSELGTAKWEQDAGLRMAGKTGTKQVADLSREKKSKMKCEEFPIKERHHGWFTGFAPAENPKITVAVFAEHSCHGSSGAAPIANIIARAYLERYFPGLAPKLERGKFTKRIKRRRRKRVTKSEVTDTKAPVNAASKASETAIRAIFGNLREEVTPAKVEEKSLENSLEELPEQ